MARLLTKVEKGILWVGMEMAKDPQPSSTGKTLLVCNSGGYQATELKHNGEDLDVTMGATIRNRSYTKPQQ